MHDEHADGHGHFALMNQLIEDLRSLVLYPILIDVQARRFGRIVLPGNIDPVIPNGSGKDLALLKRILGDFAFGDVIGTRHRRGRSNEEYKGRGNNWQQARHGWQPLVMSVVRRIRG